MIHHFSFQGKLNYKDYQKTNNKIRERNANIRSRIRYGRHFGIISDRAFKMAKINMLRNLIQKVDNMDDISRDIKARRKNQKEMLEI